MGDYQPDLIAKLGVSAIKYSLLAAAAPRQPTPTAASLTPELPPAQLVSQPNFGWPTLSVRPALALSIAICVGLAAIGGVTLHLVTTASHVTPTTVAATTAGTHTSNPAPSHPAVKKKSPPKQTTSSSTTTAVTPPKPSPPPSLPVVAGKDTHYNLGVLVIKYFPLTANGQNININVTGDVGGSYAAIRQHTTDVTNNLIHDLPRASTYLGYKYGGDKPALSYNVVATYEHKYAVPINSTIHAGYPTYPDYNPIMTQHNICNYVDSKGVQEVWLWAYQGPSTQGPNHD